MKLMNKDAEIFVPDARSIEAALARTTHMAVSAHQDDIEIMAYDGIAKCFDKDDEWFLGTVVTNGTGSVKTGIYSGLDDHEFKMVRFEEQKKASVIGKYGAVALLDYTSGEAKDPSSGDIVRELSQLIRLASPDVVYTHNPADKHVTHVAVALRTIQAIRALPACDRPCSLYGCEVWRSLDWMLDKDKTVFDVDKYTDIAWALLKVFESQISGAKKYDEAAMARRLSNSTFYDSMGTDASNSLSYAMDLTPLIKDDNMDIETYVGGFIERFAGEVSGNIRKLL